MPTFLFIQRGDVVDKMMGANPTKLQELLEEYSWTYKDKKRVDCRSLLAKWTDYWIACYTKYL